MIKSERGSVTVFTLSACLLMSFILVGIFMGSQNKVINQKKQLKSIENSYKENSDDEKMEQLYEEAMKNDSSNIEADLKITTAQELKEFATKVNNGDNFSGKTVVLMNDIDLASVCSSTIGSWTPIGNNTTNSFNGTFNGRKYTISNIYMANTDNVQALFGVNKGTIKNLIVSEGTIKGVPLYSSGMVSRNYGTIESCRSENLTITCENTSTSEANIGGIVARNESGSTIRESVSVSNIITNKAKGHTGGIAGLNAGRIENSHNTSVVTNTNTSGNGTGGIVGWGSGTVSKCYNEGNIEGKDNVGGIVGNTNNTGNVELSYNKAEVVNSDTTASSGENAAGIIGWNRGNVSNCYNIGKITNKNTNSNIYTGGLIGLNSGPIKNSYNIGEIVPSGGKIGAIIGRNYSTMTNCYAIKEILKNGVSYEEGTTTSTEHVIESTTLKTYTSKLNEDGANTYWSDDKNIINNGYPILSWK